MFKIFKLINCVIKFNLAILIMSIFISLIKYKKKNIFVVHKIIKLTL